MNTHFVLRLNWYILRSQNKQCRPVITPPWSRSEGLNRGSDVNQNSMWDTHIFPFLVVLTLHFVLHPPSAPTPCFSLLPTGYPRLFPSVSLLIPNIKLDILTGKAAVRALGFLRKLSCFRLKFSPNNLISSFAPTWVFILPVVQQPTSTLFTMGFTLLVFLIRQMLKKGLACMF